MGEALVAGTPVEVGVLTFTELFEGPGLPLGVDTYQRGFVWSDEKVRQLALDLSEYEAAADPKPDYYMGTVLLHRNEGKRRRFIIDGQQRLTALCVLHAAVKGSVPRNCEMTYSPQSATRIRSAAALYEEESREIHPATFSRIAFTIICVDDVDLAFTFFDTQNNRGVPLHATDLLKAHHLRVVAGAQGPQRDRLQDVCARRWEGLQQGRPVMSHAQEFTASLFTKFLWRARCWTGRQAGPGSHEALLAEFEDEVWPVESDHASIPLYPSRHNRRAAALTLNVQGEEEMQVQPLAFTPRADDLPFAIRQPIHEGLGFFLYTDKYAALLRRIMSDDTASPEVERTRAVYQALLTTNSLFLREVFLLSLLMFADQFGEVKLWEFSLWMEHALGAVRLEKQQVRRETAQNFFKERDVNLLDVIARAYRPEQVIRHLRQHHAGQAVYAQEQVALNAGTVQATYKLAVLRYFGKEEGSLQNKHRWIEALVGKYRT